MALATPAGTCDVQILKAAGHAPRRHHCGGSPIQQHPLEDPDPSIR